MMRKTVLLSLLLAPALAAAATPVKTREFGADTRAWLDLQKSGSAAYGSARPMPGEVAEKVYERYLKSFSQPIPDQFRRDRFVEGGGGR
jgi:hypothetical protein